jgi:hypothetical protein
MRISQAITITTLVLGLLAPVFHAKATQPSCLDSLRKEWADLDFTAKKTRLGDLKGSDMRCLLETAKAENTRLQPAFFLDQDHRAANQLQRFLGKNSLSISNRFEKRFFSVGDDRLFGYNSSPLGTLLRAPGFFQVGAMPEGTEPSLEFDYRPDFVSLIGTSIPEVLRSSIPKVKNNTDPIFRDSADQMYRLTDDLVVGQDFRFEAGKPPKEIALFVLLRNQE